jgi:endonuclease III
VSKTRKPGPSNPTRKRESYKRPTRRRVAAIRDRLRRHYGQPRNAPHHAPLDELVLTILSQNTNDRNRDIAYTRLRDRFPGWADVAAAPVGAVEEAIRPGGISKVKAARIKRILNEIAERPNGASSRAGRAAGSRLDLAWLETAPRERAFEFLEALPGVGRKTAACVLLFSYDRPELPVDTHVYRVSTRLGLIRPKAPFEEAHDVLRDATEPGDVFELHVNLIRHGRRLCRPRDPLCGECPLLTLCPYGRARRAERGRDRGRDRGRR